MWPESLDAAQHKAIVPMDEQRRPCWTLNWFSVSHLGLSQKLPVTPPVLPVSSSVRVKQLTFAVTHNVCAGNRGA